MPITGAYGGVIGKDNTPSPAKKVTTITSNGCFNRTAPTATVIVLAGGGGGSDGGGGAGGLLVTECHPLPTCAVPVTIGAGGAGDTNACGPGTNGSNSVFGSATPLTATGGGAGGRYNQAATDGGSGGGSGGGSTPREGGGYGTAGQGSHGGHYSGSGGGGGGGACTLGFGQGEGGNVAACGGMGRDLTPFGVPTCLPVGEVYLDRIYLGGGGAGKAAAGNAWQRPEAPAPAAELARSRHGEGGKGQPGTAGRSQIGVPSPVQAPTDGAANTGGGGGGAGWPGSPPFPSCFSSKAGGSGIVIVVESEAGASANSGVYSMKEQYNCIVRSSW